ncbi:BURP domain protein RD22-like [Hibiscus syriacus]|nr:BURP domain protein RD22-like [Hibiscus syriacus]
MVYSSEFGAYWDGDDSDKKPNTKDSPDSKGINDPEFGAYGYDDSYAKSNTKDSPDNKGINDPEFGNYAYDDSYAKPKTEDNSDKNSNTEDSLVNKGVNDPGFGDFGYQYTKSKSEDDLDSGFGDFGYQYTKSKTQYNSNKGYDTEKLPVNRKALRGHENTAIKETIYFFQETLLPGTKVNLPRILQKSPMATFLPRQIEESLAPMSNDKLPEILNNFSLKAESKGAVYVEVAVKNCERDEMKGEAKYCASSLESFVDLGVSVLGKNIRLLWHELAEETKNPMFTIGHGVGHMGGNSVVCHKMKYPYAVYLCHSIEKTEVFKVPLVSEDGTKANAMAVCHKDTSFWSPNHLAFKILKIKPGTVPICHFLGRDTLVWIPN